MGVLITELPKADMISAGSTGLTVSAIVQKKKGTSGRCEDVNPELTWGSLDRGLI